MPTRMNRPERRERRRKEAEARNQAFAKLPADEQARRKVRPRKTKLAGAV